MGGREPVNAGAAFAIVLHSHLPFVRHPEYPVFLEEEWLFEALSESYLPLLDAAFRLKGENVAFRLNVTVSPTLCEMLADDLLMSRYEWYLEGRLSFLEEERQIVERPFLPVVEMYIERYVKCRDLFLGPCRRRPLRLFRLLRDAGVFELITCPATHALLPLLATEEGVRAQIGVGVENFRRHFGDSPGGIWLSECAYSPGMEKTIAGEGLDYFLLDGHALLTGDPPPASGVDAPVRCPNGVVVFPRNADLSERVWSRDHGYPGDVRYREFHRDLGFERDPSRLRRHLGGAAIKRNTGIKYYRITGDVDLSEKEPYDPTAAESTADRHAAHFVGLVSGAVRDAAPRRLITVAFDTELFGHWWHEGLRFLETVIRLVDEKGSFPLTGLSEFLFEGSAMETVQPAASSWGEGNSFEFWLRDGNDWIYRHLRHGERRLVALARRHRASTGLPERVLNQAARELLLAQSSDWAFLIASGDAASYAEKRTKEHLSRLLDLLSMIERGKPDRRRLEILEKRDPLFPEIDFRLFAPVVSSPPVS